jgi:hypothetical protein
MGEFREVTVSILLLLTAGAWLFIVPGLVLQAALANLSTFGTSTHEADACRSWAWSFRRPRDGAGGRGSSGSPSRWWPSSWH